MLLLYLFCISIFQACLAGNNKLAFTFTVNGIPCQEIAETNDATAVKKGPAGVVVEYHQLVELLGGLSNHERKEIISVTINGVNISNFGIHMETYAFLMQMSGFIYIGELEDVSYLMKPDGALGLGEAQKYQKDRYVYFENKDKPPTSAFNLTELLCRRNKN